MNSNIVRLPHIDNKMKDGPKYCTPDKIDLKMILPRARICKLTKQLSIQLI